MSETPGLSSVTEGGVTITSTSETPEQISEALKPAETPETPEAPAEDLSEAAAKLGKKGGEVAAAKRQEAKQTPTQTETPQDPDQDEDDETPEAKLGKPRHDPKARIAQLVRERNEERIERERLAREVEQLRVSKETPKAKEHQKATDEDPEPQIGDYEDYAEYNKDAARWAARQEYRQQHEATQREAKVRYMASTYAKQVDGVMSSYLEKLEEAAKENPAFFEETRAVATELQPTWALDPGQRRTAVNVIADEVTRSAKAPGLMRYFTEQPTEFQRLKALRDQDEIKVEVRLIARSLGAATTATSPKPEVSKAPSPVRPVTGAPHAVESVPGDNASYEAHKAYWMQKDRAARR